MKHELKRALISVSDKAGIVDFARGLSALSVELVSTKNTKRTLEDAGLSVRSVQDITGYPEMMEGRVKTLHPRIHGGLLARRDNPEDVRALDEHAMAPIDLVVVNLYPFQQTVAKPGVTRQDALENIDIGGPTMLRAAAKNHNYVAVVVHPEDYDVVLSEMRDGGGVTAETRQRLALAAFDHTATYDTAISNWLHHQEEPDTLPSTLCLHATKMHDLRYGENPHQRAALYRTHVSTQGLPDATVHQGKALSYNNLIDLMAAYELCRELGDNPAAVVVKHTNPCNAATSKDGLLAAYKDALACDPISAFGGIVALNQSPEPELVGLLTETFLEIVVAPEFSPEALESFSRKKNLRVVSMPLQPGSFGPTDFEIRRVDGGIVVQDRDTNMVDLTACDIVTERPPTPDEMRSLQFAWRVAKHVKSNAIIFTRGTATAAVGAGQMSRIDSVKLCELKAQEPLPGTVMASDAFFPFRDGIDAAFKAGATAVVQPGGSRRDEEVIAAANEHGMAMVLTRTRHFKH